MADHPESGHNPQPLQVALPPQAQQRHKRVNAILVDNSQLTKLKVKKKSVFLTASNKASPQNSQNNLREDTAGNCAS